MSISYENLWVLLSQKGLDKSDLCNRAEVTDYMISRMERNLSVPIEVLSRICCMLECGFDDIVKNADANLTEFSFPVFEISSIFDDSCFGDEFYTLGIKTPNDFPKPHTIESIRSTLETYIEECKLSRGAVDLFVSELEKYNIFIKVSDEIKPDYRKIPIRSFEEYVDIEDYSILDQQINNYYYWVFEDKDVTVRLNEFTKKLDSRCNSLVNVDFSKFVKVNCSKNKVEYKTTIERADRSSGFPFNLLFSIFGIDDCQYYFRYHYNDIFRYVENVLETLTPQEKFIVRVVYELGITIKELCCLIKVPGQDIIRIVFEKRLSRALRKLRHPSRSKHLIKCIFSQCEPRVNIFDLEWAYSYYSCYIENILKYIKIDYLLGVYSSGYSSLKTFFLLVDCLNNNIEEFYLFSIDAFGNIIYVDIISKESSIFKSIISKIKIPLMEVDNRGVAIVDMDLSVRAYNCLARAGIQSLEDILSLTEDDLFKIRNLGKRALEEVLLKVAEYGYSLNKDGEFEPVAVNAVLGLSCIGFANYYKKIYGTGNINIEHMLKEKFMEQCVSLGFNLDIANWFLGILPNGDDILENIEMLSGISDSKLLGSLILLKWYNIVNSSNESLLSEENRIWFIIAFNQLYENATLEAKSKESEEDIDFSLDF